MTRAIYIRTSTDEQDGAGQRHALIAAARARGWRTAADTHAMPDTHIYEDRGESGVKASRPALDALRADVRLGNVREVLTAALDRLGRNLADVVLLLDEWGQTGVAVRTIREGDLDPATPVGRFMVHIFAALAELERGIIRERQRAGIEAARAKGKHLGRPRVRVDPDTAQKAYQRWQAGESLRSLARAFKIPLRTIRRALLPFAVAKGGGGNGTGGSGGAEAASGGVAE